MLDLHDEFRDLIRTLNAEGVDYALCGGLALAAHGFPRATMDIDLLTRLESMGAAIRSAQTHGYALDAGVIPLAQSRLLLFRLTKFDPQSGDHLSLYLLLPTESSGLNLTTENMELDGLPVRVVSRESLIALKRLRNSPQDQIDIARLENEGTAP